MIERKHQPVPAWVGGKLRGKKTSKPSRHSSGNDDISHTPLNGIFVVDENVYQGILIAVKME